MPDLPEPVRLEPLSPDWMEDLYRWARIDNPPEKKGQGKRPSRPLRFEDLEEME